MARKDDFIQIVSESPNYGSIMETKWGSDQILHGDSTVKLVMVDFEIAQIVHSGSWLKRCGFPEALEDCGVRFLMVSCIEARKKVS